MLHSALRAWLHPGDSLLGPGQLGRDPLEAALHGFEGVAGGPHLHPWQAGSRRGVGYAMEEAGGPGAPPVGAPAPSPYPQPKALGAALLEAQLAAVGRLLAAVAPVNRAAIMDALLAMAQGGPQKKKDKEPAKRQAAAMAAAAAALAGAAALGGGGGRGGGGAELAPRMRQLADEVLEESAGSVVLQRAAADLYAASAALGGDGAALALVRGLCQGMAETASLGRRAALALSVGSVARAVGGLSLQPALAVATGTLVAVAGATDASASLWILHAMLLLANAAGLAFVPHLSHLLNLAEASLLSGGCGAAAAAAGTEAGSAAGAGRCPCAFTSPWPPSSTSPSGPQGQLCLLLSSAATPALPPSLPACSPLPPCRGRLLAARPAAGGGSPGQRVRGAAGPRLHLRLPPLPRLQVHHQRHARAGGGGGRRGRRGGLGCVPAATDQPSGERLVAGGCEDLLHRLHRSEHGAGWPRPTRGHPVGL
jgi:hypothetical protein